MKIKKILAGILASAITFTAGILPNINVPLIQAELTASAETKGTYGDFTYTAYDDYVKITKCNSSETSVVIPDVIEGLPVEIIGLMAFSSCKNLENVTIQGNSITSIEPMAFYSSAKLASINIPDSVTSIGSGAFYDCKSLADIEIPVNVTFFGEDAFKNTPWLEAQRAKNPLVIINSIVIDGKTCEGDIVIPAGVTSIGDSAFKSCTSFISIDIPNSVTSIEKGAFMGCTSLASIVIPESVTSIGYNAFSDTPWLEAMRANNSLVIMV